MREFKKLKIWEKAHMFVLNVYKLTVNFPKTETYGLTMQIRRSSSSIAINIVEGCGRFTRKDFQRFLYIALGSAYESHYLLMLINDLGYLKGERIEQLLSEAQELKKMLTVFIQRIPN